MSPFRPLLATGVAVLAAVGVDAGPAHAATPVTIAFAGTVTSTMSVNDGTNTGSIPAGTPYTGTFVYDAAQTPTRGDHMTMKAGAASASF